MLGGMEERNPRGTEENGPERIEERGFGEMEERSPTGWRKKIVGVMGSGLGEMKERGSRGWRKKISHSLRQTALVLACQQQSWTIAVKRSFT